MPIRGSPNGANHLRPQAGRDRLEQVVAINRNAWSQSIGTAGRNHPVRALGTLAIGKRCQERISATGWARGSGQFAESALDTLYVARNRG
jgi:hypothetical protein